MQTMLWQGNALQLLDQTKLPNSIEQIICNDWQRVAEAIRRLEVRGAPAIGVAAAYGFVLGAKSLQKEDGFFTKLAEVGKELKATRPTAVNLFWAIDRMQDLVDGLGSNATPLEVCAAVEELAQKMEKEDIAINERMGEFGAELFTKPISVLTHCNAGALATVAWGTALGVIRKAFMQGNIIRVFADETRPLLQGARLTAWEMVQEKIPVTVITDNMAGWVMKKGMVQAVVTGADRIAANGDTANKIGTYSVAVLAKENGIPFYIAAPTSTFDFSLSSGDEIVIEERKADEVTSLAGIRTAPLGVDVFNPSFDVTPNKYIAGIITEYGVIKAPYTQEIMKLKERMVSQSLKG